MAEYEKDGEYIRNRDFTLNASVNYEAIESIVDAEEDYQINFEAIHNLSCKAAKEYVEMIYLDTIVFNVDRHTKNYGLLRNVETGEVIGLAPNFDNNIALISRGYPKNIERTKDKLIELFCDFINNNETAKEYFSEINQVDISEELIKECISETGFNIDEDLICKFILNGCERIEGIIHSLEFGLQMK